MIYTKDSDVAAELLVVLCRCATNITKKLPKDLLEYYKKLANKNHLFEYDEFKSLKEQNLKEETKQIIAIIYRDYVCTEEQRAKYNAEMKKKAEEQKVGVKQLEAVFNDPKVYDGVAKLLPAERRKENIISKIFSKIKSFFG